MNSSKIVMDKKYLELISSYCVIFHQTTLGHISDKY